MPWIATTSRDCEQAVSDFQQALDLDPSFADAAAGLADTYLQQLGSSVSCRARRIREGPPGRRTCA